MFRTAAILLMALALVSCGSKGPNIEGKWAWFDPAACEADRDTIEFDGETFYHRRDGAVFVFGQNVSYRTTTENGASWVTATYTVESEDDAETVMRSVSLTFEPQGENTLIFQGSVVDGVAPRNAASAIGRELYRCHDGQAVLDGDADSE